MDKERGISTNVQKLLWAISAGRCEFKGCNKILYRHEITGLSDNLGEMAHILAVNKGGARYQSDDKDYKNNIDNLMFVCPACHKVIDDNEEQFTVEVLQKMKKEHEERIFSLTGIGSDKSCNMLFYTANIGNGKLSVNENDAREALAQSGLFTYNIPPIKLGTHDESRDNENDYYIRQVKNLRKAYITRVEDVIEKGERIAIFALAPQPLLMFLGSLINDKYNTFVFQCQREQANKWLWTNETDEVNFILEEPREILDPNKVALSFALSAQIQNERITNVMGTDVSIYKITIASPNRYFVTNTNIQNSFAKKFRDAVELIKRNHGKKTVIHIFPAMPNSLAVRAGMDIMSKADNAFKVYDEVPSKGFNYALSIGECDE